MRNSKIFIAICCFCCLVVGGAWISTHPAYASSLGQIAYNLVQNSGSPLTRRTTINCTGALTCSDSGGVTEFNATGGGGSGTAGSPLFVQTSSVTVTSNAETSLLGSGTGSTTIPANWFTSAGSVMEICASGVITTAAVAQGTVQLKLKFGSTVVAQTAAYTPTASMTNNAYDACVRLTARTVGAMGTIMATNLFPSVGTTTVTTQATNLTNPTPGTAVTVDTTATQAVDFTVTFSANATNSITQTNFYMVGPGSAVSSVQGLTGAVNLFATNAQTSTYQVLASDFSACKTITVASGTFTITLVASGSQPASGRCITVINYGTGTVSIARSGQNINGQTGNLTLGPAAGSGAQPTGAYIVSDGMNYEANVFGAGSAGGGANITSGGFASLPGTCTHTSTQSDLYYATDSWWINAVCTATNTQSWVGQYGMGTPADAISNWTGVNLTNSHLTCTNSVGVTECQTTNTGGLNWGLYAKNVPSIPFIIDMFWRAYEAPLNSITSGFYYYDNTKLMGIEHLSQAGNSQFRVEKINSVTSDNSTAAALQALSFVGPLFGGVCGRLADDGSTLTFAYSLDCRKFTTIFSEAVGTFITPTKYGFGGLNATSTTNTTDMWIPMINVH